MMKSRFPVRHLYFYSGILKSSKLLYIPCIITHITSPNSAPDRYRLPNLKTKSISSLMSEDFTFSLNIMALVSDE